MKSKFLDRVIAYADRRGFSEAPTPMGICGLSVVRARNPSALMNTLYTPLLCLVLQGQKETRFGDQTITFGKGDTLIVSINMPTVSQVTLATKAAPFVSLAFEIDLGMIRTLQAELDLDADNVPESTSIASGVGGEALVGAMRRLFDLHDRPVAEQKVIGHLLKREIHFRILFENHSGMLRSIARRDTHESRINRTILKLRNDYAEPIAVQDLAELAGMSASSFHEHFKAVTAKSPLQFLKDLRLLVAQQKLSTSAEQVSTIAFDVGYGSIAQFSRDYTRKFGYPPSQERKRKA